MVSNLVIAYEPVWAIGTGRTPTAGDVEEVHGFIRSKLTDKMNKQGAAVRILYGGSVKPSNAAELMAVPNVGGALVGGASLKAADFLAISNSLSLNEGQVRPHQGLNAGSGFAGFARAGRGGIRRFHRVDTAQLQLPQTPLAAVVAVEAVCDGRIRCRPSLSSFIS